MASNLKALVIATVVLVCGCKAKVNPPSPPPSADHSITFTFNQNFADAPPCSSTVTTSCISGFNEGYQQNGTDVLLHTDTTSICSGSTQPEACSTTFNSVIPIGSIIFYVNTKYVDQTGKAGATADDVSSAIQVAADAATSLSVVVN